VLAQLGAVEHQDVGIEVACSTRLSAARTTRTGVTVSHAKINIRMKPKINANMARIITASSQRGLIALFLSPLVPRRHRRSGRRLRCSSTVSCLVGIVAARAP
jgi:hypothetical protein